jgi:drug/metabolite transporter (DMT)-like permease
VPPAPWKVWTALGLVYVFWGSTYLAIRYAVDGYPPLLTAGARSLIAGVLLAVYVVARRGRAPFRATRRQWGWSAVIGLLLLTGGNGGVTLAEDSDLPSGLAALLVACVPLFVVVLRAVTGDRPQPRTLLGVAIGFVGLAFLLLPGSRPSGVSLTAALTVVGASLLWSIGSFQASRVSLPADPLVTTVAQMLGGALGLLVVGSAAGETLPGTFHLGATVALAYLVVFGSVVAFTAYSWLLGVAPVSQVATYAYVNPVVAVVLGALVAGEHVTVTSVVGGLITVVAVFVVVSEEGRRRKAPLPDPPEAYEPEDRQGRLRSSAT